MDPIATTGREWRQRHSLTHWVHGQGREEGHVSSDCRGVREAPLPIPLSTPPSWGDGIHHRRGGSIQMRPNHCWSSDSAGEIDLYSGINGVGRAWISLLGTLKLAA